VRPAVARGVFLAGALGLAALMLWAMAGVPGFGDYRHAYGRVLNRVAVGERHSTDVVTAIVFDYRGFDTMGEETILFASAAGVALLAREAREGRERPRDRVRAPGVRASGLGVVAPVVVLGLAIVAHGYITPGGGFQGGVILAAGAALVYLAGGYRAFRSVTPSPLVDAAEGGGIAAFVAIGLAGMAAGSAFLDNVLPLGAAGNLLAAGTIPLLNWATGIEVAAAFILIFTEFLENLMELGGRTAGEGGGG